MELYVRDKASDVSSTTRNFRPDGFYDEIRYVPILCGDDALQSCLREKDIALIKIDVEGGELEVVQGLKNILALPRIVWVDYRRGWWFWRRGDEGQASVPADFGY